MRHLGSIVLAIVFAPLIYLLAGVGQVKFVTGTSGSSTDWTAVGIGIAALVAAGLLYTLLVMVRLSPLGPVVAAGLFIGVELWAVFDRAGLVNLIGSSTLGVSGAQEAPLTGLALVLAIPLLITIVSPRRWRGRDKVVPVYGGAAPTYGTTESAAPTYAPIQTSAETAADASPGEADAEPAAETAEAGEAGEAGDETADTSEPADGAAAEQK